MLDIIAPKNVYQQARKITFISIIDNEWFSTQSTMSMFYGCKSVVDIAHVPMQVLHPPVMADMMEVLIKHLPFQIITPISNFIERRTLTLCHLMNGKRNCLP